MQTLLHVTMYDNPCLCPGLSHFPIFVHPLEHKFHGVRSCVLLNTLSPALKALSDMSQVLNGCCALPAVLCQHCPSFPSGPSFLVQLMQPCCGKPFWLPSILSKTRPPTAALHKQQIALDGSLIPLKAGLPSHYIVDWAGTHNTLDGWMEDRNNSRTNGMTNHALLAEPTRLRILWVFFCLFFSQILINSIFIPLFQSAHP